LITKTKDLEFTPCLEARDLPEAFFLGVKECLNNGFDYQIEKGSFVGTQRRQLDFLFMRINDPGRRPLVPSVPDGVPAPTSMEYIEQYMEYLMTSNKAAKNQSYCYDDQTEVLTDKGWLLFKDLDRSERVATLNPATNEIEYQFPDSYYDEPYSGDMVQISGRMLDAKVTPNHKLYVAHENTDKYELTDHPKGWRYRFKRNGEWVGVEDETFLLPAVHYDNERYRDRGGEREIPMDDWLRFLGIWLAEGSLRRYSSGKTCYMVMITQCDPDRTAKILGVVKKIFPNANTYGKDIYINDKQLYSYLQQFGLQCTRFIPRALLALSKRQLSILFEWLYFGDGDKGRPKGSGRYTTCSKLLADQVQELCLKIGLSASIFFDGWYRVMISSQCGNEPHVRAKKRQIVSYNGRVYCVHVPIHNIIYVRRNGKPQWCGNSYGQSIEKQIFKIIENVKRFGPNQNQLCMRIGTPESIDLDDPECLTTIDVKIRHGKINFFVYYRSWDLLSGFPSNLGGIQLMKEFLAHELSVEDGCLIIASGGAHLYDFQLRIAKRICGMEY
jgi:hypothetical protein